MTNMTGEHWRQLTLACPRCGAICGPGAAALTCRGCGANYAVESGVPAMIAGVNGQKAAIQEFWSRGARRRLETGDPGYGWRTQEELLANLARVESRYATTGLFARELPLAALQGMRVLEVGCGSGGASLVMCKHGARVVAGDLSAERAANAARMHAASPWAGRDFVAVQLDAERLPFPDGYFDAVLSNGVLHHTSDTARAIREVHRVLRPRGSAAVMLYGRRSLMYAGLWLYHGVLRGQLWRDPDWLSHVSEQDDSVGGLRNPVTRAYSTREIRELFQPFERVEIRQDVLAVFSARRFRSISALLAPLAPWLGWCLYIRGRK